LSGFERLDHRIQRWIWEKKWRELRDVQDRAIPIILDSSNHVLICAATAAGKTEAAFLPALTSVVERKKTGFSILYISPLKALINDQFRRLEELCEALEIDVVRWHGDAPQAGKDKAVKNPKGVSLITPESIEALFVRRPALARRMFADIDFVIIDELHYFLEGPRGLHLASLLNRLDAVSVKPARRIGLSATVGDIEKAKIYLTSGAPELCSLLVSSDGRPELRTQIKAYIEDDDVEDQDALESEAEGKLALDKIADDIFRYFRTTSNLVFAGSRRRVESLTDRLRDRCEKNCVPNEFFAHHGSLAKEMREDLEARLKQEALPTTAVATTTLELGIDIGQVKATAQIDAPQSMAALRQRLGRTGRREGVPAVLRLFVRERRVHGGSFPIDRMRMEVARSVAAIRLLIADYIEPPQANLSVPTIVFQQVLSLTAEYGGMTPSDLYRMICGKGLLSEMPKSDFVLLLKGMAHPNLKFIEQAPSGLIMLGEQGERRVAKHDFFALFETIEEWRVMADGKPLGTLPLSNMLGPGSYLSFAGKRWRVEAVDNVSRVIEVVSHRSGKVPKFETLGNEYLDRRIVEETREVLRGDANYPYLDPVAKDLLTEACLYYKDNDLDGTVILSHRDAVLLFTWRGTTVNQLLALVFKMSGLPAEVHDAGLHIPATNTEDVARTLATWARVGVTIDDAAAGVETYASAKWDEFIPVEVLRSQWKRTYADAIPEVNELLNHLVGVLGVDLEGDVQRPRFVKSGDAA
jgi:ATP-dependent Lhr-like helicase